MSRTEKYQLLVNECITKMNEDDRAIYLPILEYALELGFTPKLLKKANEEDGELAFSKSKFNRTLLRILPENKKEFSNYPLKKAGKAIVTVKKVAGAAEERFLVENRAHGAHYLVIGHSIHQ